MLKCDKNKNGDEYCCESDDNCDCNTGNNTAKLLGPATTVTVIGETSWVGISSSTSSTSSRPTASVNATVVVVKEPSQSAEPSAEPSPIHSGTDTVKVGLGIGIPLGIALIAALSYIAYRSRPRTNVYRRGEGLVPLAENHAYELFSKSRPSSRRSVATDKAEVDSREIFETSAPAPTR